MLAGVSLHEPHHLFQTTLISCYLSLGHWYVLTLTHIFATAYWTADQPLVYWSTPLYFTVPRSSLIDCRLRSPSFQKLERFAVRTLFLASVLLGPHTCEVDVVRYVRSPGPYRLRNCNHTIRITYQTPHGLQTVRLFQLLQWLLPKWSLYRTDSLIRTLVVYSISTCALTR